MTKYEIIIWWSKEDNCYLAEIPKLPGCMADGESLAEVAAEIEESIRLWIEVILTQVFKFFVMELFTILKCGFC